MNRFFSFLINKSCTRITLARQILINIFFNEELVNYPQTSHVMNRKTHNKSANTPKEKWKKEEKSLKSGCNFNYEEIQKA